jgi:hypothetical protein
MSGPIEEMVTVFVVRCPLGEQCSKKHGILGKRLSEHEARQVIVNHLKASPYHELDQEVADAAAEAAIVESWEETSEVADATKAEEGDGWFNNRKRGRTSKMSLAEARDLVRAADGSGSAGSGIAIGAPARGRSSALAIPIPQVSQNITLPRYQMKACVDSLQRARNAAESAGQLCGRASRAFYEEAACITSCQDVLESYMQS